MPENEGSSANVIRRSLGLRSEVAGSLHADYHSRLIDWTCRNEHRLEAGSLQIRLAGEFGFCYGVDRAVELAYETIRRFPDRRIFITNEIIHNPDVNRQLQAMGVRFLQKDENGQLVLDDLLPEDVVIIPAFGACVELQQRLESIGCVMVDTTCGSVVRVWKRVEKLAREGYTSIIHGTYTHEETIATASRAMTAGGRYLVVRDEKQAGIVCKQIEGNGDPEEFLRRFSGACSPGFDPHMDLQRVGFANQTTMLASESLAIAEMIREALSRRHGADSLKHNYRSFDTICSATQDRQDAMLEMAEWKPDLMLIVGGFNSSNTGHLCEIAATYTRAWHIEGADCLVSVDEIRHKRPGERPSVSTVNWLPEGDLKIGVTAGASTPNRVTGAVIERLLQLRGIDPPNLDQS